MGLDALRAGLEPGNFGHRYEGHLWRATRLAIDHSVSHNGMVSLDRSAAGMAPGSVVGPALVVSRRHRLHGRGRGLRRAPRALQPFGVAPVRGRGNDLPFLRGVVVFGVTLEPDSHQRTIHSLS